MQLRRPMRVLFVGGPVVLRFAPIRGKPIPQLVRTDLPSLAEGRSAYRVNGLPG